MTSTFLKTQSILYNQTQIAYRSPKREKIYTANKAENPSSQYKNLQPPYPSFGTKNRNPSQKQLSKFRSRNTSNNTISTLIPYDEKFSSSLLLEAKLKNPFPFDESPTK